MTKKILVYGCSALLLLAACKSAKKIQTAVVSPVHKDSVAQLSVTPSVRKIDSMVWAREIVDSAVQHLPAFRTFTGKMGVSFQSASLNQDVNANVRIRKDSLIWVSLTGPFNIEGARALISPDSVCIINKLNHTVERHSIALLQRLVHIPLTFDDVQNILIGGPLLYKGRVQSFDAQHDAVWIIELLDGILHNKLTIDRGAWRTISMQVTDRQGTAVRSSTISYSGFDNKPGFAFPQKRNISVNDKSHINIDLQYKQYSFNEKIDFPFNIPSSYKSN